MRRKITSLRTLHNAIDKMPHDAALNIVRNIAIFLLVDDNGNVVDFKPVSGADFVDLAVDLLHSKGIWPSPKNQKGADNV